MVIGVLVNGNVPNFCRRISASFLRAQQKDKPDGLFIS